MTKDCLNIGVLGAGPIAQFAHLESCQKAANTKLFAICDVADDLLARVSAYYAPEKTYTNYAAMLDDAALDAVIVATADAYHVPMAIEALTAGKHVLCEKPIATSLEEVFQLKAAVQKTGKVLQVGHMKRFDPGLQAAKKFIDDGIGQLQAIKAWYCDSTHRYTNTDAIQPLPIKSAKAKKPAGDSKTDKEQYFMLAHGSHLVDTARYFGGDLVAVRARMSEIFGAYCWFVDVEYANGCLGHLDLTVAVRMDWHEGFHIYGEHGAIVGKTYNPWYYRASEVDIFHETDASSRRVLGADGHFYRRQVEGFARAILNDTPIEGADIEDGEASVRAMLAIRDSVRSGQRIALKEVQGSI
ncbi:MAG: putative dehydrogenase [Planctomycetota bacterium]|jgi:predicted dehydrogenase